MNRLELGEPLPLGHTTVLHETIGLCAAGLGNFGSTTLITLFIRGLPRSATEEEVTALFGEFGKVRSIQLVKDIFSGECKGFGTISMEGHEGRAAMSALDGRTFNGSIIGVGLDRGKPRGRRR